MPGRRNQTAPAGPVSGMAGVDAATVSAASGAGAAAITKDSPDEDMRLARWRNLAKKAVSQVSLLVARAVRLHREM